MEVREYKKKSIRKTYLIYFIVLIAFLFIRIGSAKGVFADMDTQWGELGITAILQVGILFLLPLVLYCLFIRVTPRQLFKTCNFFKTNFSVVLISFAIGIIVYFLSVILATMFNGIITLVGYKNPIVPSSSGEEYTAVTFIIRIISVAILPAFCEEFLHRGVVLQGTKHTGFIKAILISSILFGLIHFNINQVFYAFVLGVVIGFVSVVSKNIWPAIIVHFTNNLISVYMEFASVKKLFGGDFNQTINTFFAKQDYFTVFFIVSTVLVFLCIALYFLVNLLYKHSILRSVENAINKVYNNKCASVRNSPIVCFTSDSEVRNVVESTTTLNLNPDTRSPIDHLMPKQKYIYRPRFRDNIYLIGALVLSGLVTLFTFIWGLL